LGLTDENVQKPDSDGEGEVLITEDDGEYEDCTGAVIMLD